MTPAQFVCDSSWFFAGNYFGNDGAEAIAEVLMINKTLAEVKLHCEQADCFVFRLARLFGRFLLTSTGNSVRDWRARWSGDCESAEDE